MKGALLPSRKGAEGLIAEFWKKIVNDAMNIGKTKPLPRRRNFQQ